MKKDKDPAVLEVENVQYFEATYEEVRRFIKHHTQKDIGEASEYQLTYECNVHARVSKGAQEQYDELLAGTLEDGHESLEAILRVLCKQKKLPPGDYQFDNSKRYSGIVE